MAKHVALVMAVPENSDTVCPGGTTTLIDITRNKAMARIDEELALDPHTQISIISSEVQSMFSTNRQQLNTILKKITVQSQSAETGLQQALNMLKAGTTEKTGSKEIIVFATLTNTGNVLPLLSRAEQAGIAVHFFIFNADEKKSLYNQKQSTSQHFTFASFGCPARSGKLLTAWQQKILLKIRQSTAIHLGSKLENIGLTTDLLTDLGADAYRAYEVMAQLCEENSVPLPKNKNLTTIEQIFNYIVQVKTEKSRSDGPVRKKGYTIGDADPVLKKSYTINEDGPALQKAYKKEVYYATDRNVTGNPKPADFFGIHRTDSHDLSYGFCTVSIPESHRPGQIESPFLGLDFLESTSNHVVLMKINPLSKEEMMSRIQGAVSPKPDDPTAQDILIFIHGFNQSFAMAAKRTAQIAVDLDFRGTPFMFSWPSNNSMFDYWPDREDIAWSVAHVEQLFLDLHKKFPNKGLHVIAHSMGNQALIGALNRLALHRGQEKKPFFKNIILAAPDFDARLFQEQIAPKVVGLAANWSVYASDNDAALIYSGGINEAKRLGIPLTTLEGINVIDASGVEVTPWSVPEFHSYYATKMVVIRDMTKSLKGLPPGIRKLIPRPEHPFLWLLKLPKIVHQAGKDLLAPADEVE